MIPNMLAYYKMISDNHVSIIYNGPIWADGVEGISQTLRKRLEIDELPLSISQSVFSIFIEQMYNVLHYSADTSLVSSEVLGKEFQVASGVFFLGARDGKYFIQCGNKVCDEHTVLIKERIDFLNTLDKPELRKYYKERIRAENVNPQSKGAGVGLIEIARRASSKIEYEFTPLEDGYSFFTMFVTVG
ncbi:MAG: SiaB family protein kinase [Candidatus Pelethousia sp.]|nr:SiaB family protein kinase [Candidatus Pelethousia sp.]